MPQTTPQSPVFRESVQLIGGVEYVVAAIGATEGGGTMPNPALAVFDSAGHLLVAQDDSFLSVDPMVTFRAPATGTYQVAVGDIHGGFGSFDLHVQPAGPPVTFGGRLGDYGF